MTIKFWVLEDQRCLGTIRTGAGMSSLVYVGRDCIASGHVNALYRHSVARTEWCSPPHAARAVGAALLWLRSLTMVTDSVLASGSVTAQFVFGTWTPVSVSAHWRMPMMVLCILCSCMSRC